MRLFYLVIAVVGLCIGVLLAAQVYPMIANSPYRSTAKTNNLIVSNTQAPQPTRTPLPSPTVGYQATADSYKVAAEHAIETANQAMWINVQATAQHESNVLAIVQITAAERERIFVSDSWTATAFPTSFPATASQQAFSNIQTPAAITATHEYPSLVNAAAAAENEKKYGPIRYNVFNFLGFVIALAVLFVLVRGIANWIKEIRVEREAKATAESEADSQPESVREVVTVQHPIQDMSKPTPIPCTPSQFEHFAICVTNGESMAKNHWDKEEGFGRTFIERMRAWSRTNTDPQGRAFVTVTPDNQFVPTSEFLNFMLDYLEHGVLMDGYEFEPVGEKSPTPTQPTPDFMGTTA